MRKHEQLRLITDEDARGRSSSVSPGEVASNFDPARLTQARQLKAMTKGDLATSIGVSAAAVGQYEAGTRPRPEVVMRIAECLGYPLQFFLAGRPHAKLDASMVHFRKLRSTRSYQRAKAVSYTEQIWELSFALEKRVQLPFINLPGFSGGELHPGVKLPSSPVQAAQALRRLWALGDGPIPHLARLLEVHGVVVSLAPTGDNDFKTVDAFGTSRLPRPVVVVSRERADDIYRHRFTLAHELGHLLLHGDALPGDISQEREADAFAAEFLTPRTSILPDLPRRLNFTALAEMQHVWGVSIDSLILRCREVGIFSDTTTTRAYQRLKTMRASGAYEPQPIEGFPGEQPTLLRSGFELSVQYGLTAPLLSAELAWPIQDVRVKLGFDETRPRLRLVR